MVAPAPRLPGRGEAWLRFAVAAASGVLLVVSVSLGATLYQGALLLLFAGVVVHVAALPLALMRPWVAAPLSVAGSVTIMLCAHAGTLPWPWSVTTMITQALVLALLGYRAPWLIGAGTLLVVVVAAGVLAPIVAPTRNQDAVAVNLVVFASIGGIMLAAGVVAREWHEVRTQLLSERRHAEEERSGRLVAEEKTRIARELHDVVAHSMSIITVQATSAPARRPQVDAETRQEFEEIAALSRRALTEMRALLAVLREPDTRAARVPQPQLSGVTELIVQAQRSGLSVRLLGEDCLDDRGVDEAVGLSAYRIVQEALSNVIRHAAGSDAEVRIRRDGTLDLVIRNGGGRTHPSVLVPRDADGTKGSGLLGMRERAASVGGSVTYGPTADGGYEVHAVLPLHPADAEAQLA